MQASSPIESLLNHHPIFICEGTGEEVAIRKLLEADRLVFPKAALVEITRTRKAAEIQEQYLNFEYDWPVCIVRVLDSLRERFRLGPLYRARFPVISVHTRPEIEILAIIRSGHYSGYIKKKSSMKPSAYCMQALGLGDVKSFKFLDSYWDAESLVSAAREYRRVAHREPGELFLADIIRG